MNITDAKTGDDLLTALAAIPTDQRSAALAACGIRVLREAADLCGVGDADTMGKRTAIKAIVNNF
jgi:hypothetical protein